MRIAISIPVHEKKDVVIDQIRNIRFYIESPVIVLHVSKSFYENEHGDFHELEGIKDVYINPVHYDVGWGNIAHVHISNFNYIKSIDDSFDYFVIHASNDMYLKKGIEQYISHYDAGIQRRILMHKKSMWVPCEAAWRDTELKKVMDRCSACFPTATQVEGSFFKKELFDRITEYIGSAEFWKGESYTREELYFSTVAYAITDETRLGYPTTYSEVHRYDRGLWKRERLLYSFSRLPAVRIFFTPKNYEKAHSKMVEQYRLNGSYAIKKRDIRRIRRRVSATVLGNVMNDYPGKFKLYDSLYSIKRIPREISDPLRAYIRNTSYGRKTRHINKFLKTPVNGDINIR